jgi:DNA mismatch repair ATPase MutS
MAESTAMLDMLCGFAELNLTSSRVWSCPTVREDGALMIKQGMFNEPCCLKKKKRTHTDQLPLSQYIRSPPHYGRANR